MHLKEWQVNSMLQYEAKENEFYRISKEDYLHFSEHLRNCSHCQEKYEASKKEFKLLASLEKKTSFSGKYWYAIAALFLAFLSYPFLDREARLNQANFIQLKDFGFMIKRGSSAEIKELENKWVYLLNEKQYKEVIDECEKRNLRENNLHYISALVLEGQEEDNPEYLYRALSVIQADSLKKWKTKIKKILKKDKK